MSRYGCYIMRSAVVFALDAPVCIAYQDFHAFVSAQVSFVAAFYSEVAGVVAGGVVGVIGNILCIDFANIAQDIGGTCGVVLAQDAFLDEYAREFIELFLQASVVLS